MWNLKHDFHAATVDAKIVKPSFVDPWGQDIIPRSAQRTRLIVDSRGHDVGHATKRYRLVRNPELRAAIELYGERNDLALSPWKSEYRSGNTCLVWKDSKHPIQVTGDNSTVWPMAKVQNSYTGGSSLRMDLVLCRHICENALIWGEIFSIDLNKKHVGEWSLGELLEPAMQSFGDKISVAQLQMEVLQKYPLEHNNPVWVKVKEDTPKRYHKPLGRAIRENTYQLGRTVYAGLQSISEVGSNEMRGWAGIGWTERQTAKVLAAAKADGMEMAV